VLTLLSATVVIEEDDNVDSNGSINGGVEKMVIDDDNVEKKGRKVTICYDDMGGIIGGKFCEEEEEDSMLVRLNDGRRVIKNLVSNSSGGQNDVSMKDDDAGDDSTTKQTQQHLTILISEGNFNNTQSSNQRSTLQLATDFGLPYKTIDGMDPDQLQKRNELFGISGVRGNYPQVFLTRGEGEGEVNEFLGSCEWFENNAHELGKRLAGGVKEEEEVMETTSVEEPTRVAQTSEELEEDLARPFALPNPARQALLSVVLLLLSKKGTWRSVSNAALFPEGDPSNSDRWMLLLNWRALLSMLLRTAPYLDEHKAGAPPMEASSMRSKILKSTVSLIRSCRCFFDQGVRPPGWKGSDSVELDATARALWKMTETDLLYHTHSNSCFRAQIMLYLFHPSKCSSAYYLEVMPKWMESWRNVDRCPEYDYLWMVMFSRTRKYIHPRDHDWGALRRHLLTQCGYW